MEFKHGEPISEELSEVIIFWTTAKERSRIAVENDLATNTVQRMIDRSRSVTSRTEKALLQVCKTALDNRASRINYESNKEKRSILDKIHEIAKKNL